MALCCLESADLNLALKLDRACRDMGLRWLAGSLGLLGPVLVVEMADERRRNARRQHS